MIVRHRILMSAHQGEVIFKMIKAPCTKAGSPNEALFSNRHIPQTCNQRMSAPPDGEQQFPVSARVLGFTEKAISEVEL